MKVFSTNLPDNIKAFLALIQHVEGTDNYYDPYTVRFGGSQVQPDQPHDGQVIHSNNYDSSAIGAYQFLYNTWLSLHGGQNPPMTAAAQDDAAIKLISQAGAYNDIINGAWGVAIRKTNNIWPSLPSGTQTRTTIDKAIAFIKSNLGTISGITAVLVIGLVFFC